MLLVLLSSLVVVVSWGVVDSSLAAAVHFVPVCVAAAAAVN